VRPLLHYDASTKASLTFNSTPTFPGIDFGCGSLLSFCVYGLLKTPQLPTTPRPYGNGLSVLAQPEIRHLTYATSCRTSGLRTIRPGLANTGMGGPAIGANTRLLGPTLIANEPTLVCEGLANTPVDQHPL